MTNSPAPLDHDLQRILAVRLDNAGDVVMLGPALRALRAFAPAGHLALLASPVGAQAAELLPEVDEVITVRAVWQDASDALAFDPDRERRLVQRLADGRFDAAFIFTSFSQSPFPAAYACYLAHVPVRAGQPADFGGAVLSHRVPGAPGGSHQVDRNLHLLEHLGIPVPSRALQVSLATRARASGRRLLWSAGIDPHRPYVVVAPGASAQARRFPTDRFVAVARALASELGWPIAVVGDARDVVAAQAITAEVALASSLAGLTTIPELAAVLAGARLVVCSHSAPLHLADALGVPVVCLFSGTDRESEWRPRSTPAVLLRQPTACSPCRLFECPIGLRCLNVPTSRVVGAALALLDLPAQPLDERWIPSAS